MDGSLIPRWLAWARQIQALSQTGLAFSETDYHADRYRRLLQIAAEIVADRAGLPEEPVLEEFLAQRGYATPKIDVRGALVRGGKLLLVKEGSDGRWCMPGGWADVGESPAAAMAREVREESGFIVEPRKVVGVFDANRAKRPVDFFHAYKIVFLCDVTGGEARPSSETLAVEFFSFDDLPPLSAERTASRHVEEVRAHVQDPGRRTAFD